MKDKKRSPIAGAEIGIDTTQGFQQASITPDLSHYLSISPSKFVGCTNLRRSLELYFKIGDISYLELDNMPGYQLQILLAVVRTKRRALMQTAIDERTKYVKDPHIAERSFLSSCDLSRDLPEENPLADAHNLLLDLEKILVEKMRANR